MLLLDLNEDYKLATGEKPRPEKRDCVESSLKTQNTNGRC